MVESDKGGGPSSPGAPSSSAGTSQPPIGGLVVDPREVKTNPSLTKFLRERISAAIVSGLVAIGILRPRNADGELGRRHWKGLFAFLGVIFAVIIVWTSVHIVQPGNVAVPVTFGHTGEPLDPGIHITLPFTNAYSMSTRTQNYTMSSSQSDGPAGSVDSAVSARLGRRLRDRQRHVAVPRSTGRRRLTCTATSVEITARRTCGRSHAAAFATRSRSTGSSTARAPSRLPSSRTSPTA